MKLLIENWRKFMKEAQMGYDLAGVDPPKTKDDPRHPLNKAPSWTGKSIQYTGFVIDEEDPGRQELLRMVPEGWKERAHHMTMIGPKGEKLRLPTEQFGRGCLKITAIAKNEKVIAGLVKMEDDFLLYSKNEIPHVTIATAIDSDSTTDPENPVYYLPKLSNEFEEADFEETEPIRVCGEVKEVKEKSPQQALGITKETGV